MANSIGTVALQLTANAQGVRRGTQQAQGYIGSFFGEIGRFASRAASITTGILSARGIELLVSGAKELLQLAAQTAMEYEQQAVAFEVMTGSAARGKKLLADLQKIAVETPFTVQEIVTEAKLLRAYGVETNELVDTIRQLGDVASGTGVDLSRLALAYGQVIAKGRFQATELRQFTEAGVSVREFAKTARLTSGQFLDAMENGKIGADIVVDTFRRMTSEGGKFYGLMARLQNTVKGRLNALIESGTLVTQKVGLAAFDAFNVAGFLKNLRDELGTLDMSKVTGWMKRAADGLEPLERGMKAIAAAGLEFAKASYQIAPSWMDAKEGIKSFMDFALPAVIRFTTETLKAVYAIKRVGQIAVDMNQTETGWWADAKRMGSKALSLGGLQGGLIGTLFGDEKGFQDIEKAGKKALDAAMNAMSGKGKGQQSNAWGGAFVDKVFDFAEMSGSAFRGGEDFANSFSKGFDKVGKLLSPTFKAIVDDAVKEMGKAASEPGFDQFMTNAAGLMIGRARNALGLDGGLTRDQFNRAIFADFDRLQKKVGSEIRNTAPMLESGSQAAISALDASRAEAQKQSITLENVLQVLEAAKKIQEDTKNNVRDGAKNIVDALKQRGEPAALAFPGGG